MSDFLMFHRPAIGLAEEEAVLEVLRSGWLTTGPKTKEFEARFAEFRGVRHAVAMNSCTAALHIALVAMGVGPGDEVVTSPITFASTANVIVHSGATPVFCDVQPDTLNIDPVALADALTPKTRAVIPVHFAGHPCDMDEIAEVLDGRGIQVIEDAAHAVEASYRGRPTGSLADAAAFSFYATKNITTGEGGALTTDDAGLAERAHILSLHGISGDAWKRYSAEGYRHWDIVAPGFKYNMSDIQAALGIAQLGRVHEFLGSRRRLTELYDAGLDGVAGLTLMQRRPYVDASYHIYVVRVQPGSACDRDGLISALQAQGIGVGVHFRAVHLHPYYRETFGFEPDSFPIAEQAGDTCLSLPLFPSMSDADVGRVIAAIRETLGA